MRCITNFSFLSRHLCRCSAFASFGALWFPFFRSCVPTCDCGFHFCRLVFSPVCHLLGLALLVWCCLLCFIWGFLRHCSSSVFVLAYLTCSRWPPCQARSPHSCSIGFVFPVVLGLVLFATCRAVCLCFLPGLGVSASAPRAPAAALCARRYRHWLWSAGRRSLVF